MRVTTSLFQVTSGKSLNDNMASALRGLETMGKGVGLHRPHRMAMFLGQTGHESAGWHFDREIWGPTAAQRRYEGRQDLGNTQPGDGSLFRGYTPMQITGRYNTTKFYNWCIKQGLNPPDFTKQPHLMNTDPWEGLGPLWYWSEGKTQSLNVSADNGDFLRNTFLVNGGYNGLDDRYRYYGRAGLFMLGEPIDFRSFQRKHKLVVDGIFGQASQRVMHQLLLKLPDLTFTDAPVAAPTIGFWASILRLFGIKHA